jgi:hypothetical protein
VGRKKRSKNRSTPVSRQSEGKNVNSFWLHCGLISIAFHEQEVVEDKNESEWLFNKHHTITQCCYNCTTARPMSEGAAESWADPRMASHCSVVSYRAHVRPVRGERERERKIIRTEELMPCECPKRVGERGQTQIRERFAVSQRQKRKSRWHEAEIRG